MALKWPIMCRCAVKKLLTHSLTRRKGRWPGVCVCVLLLWYVALALTSAVTAAAAHAAGAVLTLDTTWTRSSHRQLLQFVFIFVSDAESAQYRLTDTLLCFLDCFEDIMIGPCHWCRVPNGMRRWSIPPTSFHFLPEAQQRLYLAPVYNSLYVTNFDPHPKCNCAYQQPNHWIGLAKMLQYVLLQVVRNMCMIHWNHAHVICDSACDKCFVFEAVSQPAVDLRNSVDTAGKDDCLRKVQLFVFQLISQPCQLVHSVCDGMSDVDVDVGSVRQQCADVNVLTMQL